MVAVERKDLGAQVQAIASPIAKALSLDLIEVSCQGGGNGIMVRVTIDKAGGVGIVDCEAFHHSLGRALDVADPIPHSYKLEVSSPGLDRPLKTPEDFQRFIGRSIRVKLRDPIEGNWVAIGQLVVVNDQGISLECMRGKKTLSVEIPWEHIAQAKLEVKF